MHILWKRGRFEVNFQSVYWPVATTVDMYASSADGIRMILFVILGKEICVIHTHMDTAVAGNYCRKQLVYTKVCVREKHHITPSTLKHNSFCRLVLLWINSGSTCPRALIVFRCMRECVLPARLHCSWYRGILSFTLHEMGDNQLARWSSSLVK